MVPLAMTKSVEVRAKGISPGDRWHISVFTFRVAFPEHDLPEDKVVHLPDDWPKMLDMGFGQGPICAKCGRTGELTRHHVIPRRCLRQLTDCVRQYLCQRGNIFSTLCRGCHDAYEQSGKPGSRATLREWAAHFWGFLGNRTHVWEGHMKLEHMLSSGAVVAGDTDAGWQDTPPTEPFTLWWLHVPANKKNRGTPQLLLVELWLSGSGDRKFLSDVPQGAFLYEKEGDFEGGKWKRLDPIILPKEGTP